MSTDTYMDFHSPESFECKKDWNKWSKLVKNDRGNHYDPCRIGYIYNLTLERTYDLWEELQDEFDGMEVDEDLIAGLLDRWSIIYDLTQDPYPKQVEEKDYAGELTGRVLDADDNTFCRKDILSPDQMAGMLREHFGKFLQFRVD